MTVIERLKPRRDLRRVKNREPRVKPQKLIYKFMRQVEEEETHKGVRRASQCSRKGSGVLHSKRGV